jgi:glycosyltransferase involved in cell wall biosynthesis
VTALSVAIIARDEARHIAGALQSVASFADDLLVLVDQRTTDQTAAIARQFTQRVQIEPWRGFPAQRNLALDRCRHEWVLFLDADERVTPELAAEIQTTLTDTNCDGFWIPRYNHFFGRVACGGGWYPDHQLRLVRRNKTRYNQDKLVHEVAEVAGEIGSLQSHLVHLNIERFDELWRKQTSYAFQEAQTLYLTGRRARWRNLLGAPLREFMRRFVQLHGYRDGMLGLVLCGTLAYFEMVKFAHLKGLAQLRLR